MKKISVDSIAHVCVILGFSKSMSDFKLQIEN